MNMNNLENDNLLLLDDSINQMVSAIEAEDYELQKVIMSCMQGGSTNGAE